MRLWISRSGEVPIQEQLSTQIILGIVSGDLAAGERLPSTTELARRFRLHANTVRVAYRGLAERGWVEWRQGSGFYVRANGEPEAEPYGLNHLISGFLKTARDQGHTLTDIRAGLMRWLSAQRPDHILVIEPDPDLRDILIAELEDKICIRVEGCDISECSNPAASVGAVAAALSYRAEQIREALPPDTILVSLHSSSIPKILSGERRPLDSETVTVVSRWPDFLKRARATLVAVGIDPGALDIRDAHQKGWERGLGRDSFVITDSFLASRLPQCHARIFPIIADESVAELRTAVTE
jgi:DNA-binding transcriptional regulator YhcF (GntR family)